MHKKNTPAMRKALAGMTLLGALSLPLGGVAAADGGGGDRRAPSSTVVKSESTKKSEGTKKVESRDGRTPATPEGVKAECTAQIARRLTALDALTARVVAKGDAVTAEHRAAIDAIVQATKEGLTALQAEIDAATTLDALKPLCRRIVTDFRVYALVIPQVNAAVAADAITAKQTTFATLRTKLVDAIAAGRTADNGATLDALLASFDSHVAAMLAAVDGVADDALDVTVEQYNADPKVLKPALEALRTARKEAKAAARDAHHILEVISGDDDDDDAPSTTVAPTTTAAPTTTEAPATTAAPTTTTQA